MSPIAYLFRVLPALTIAFILLGQPAARGTEVLDLDFYRIPNPGLGIWKTVKEHHVSKSPYGWQTGYDYEWGSIFLLWAGKDHGDLGERYTGTWGKIEYVDTIAQQHVVFNDPVLMAKVLFSLNKNQTLDRRSIELFPLIAESYLSLVEPYAHRHTDLLFGAQVARMPPWENPLMPDAK